MGWNATLNNNDTIFDSRNGFDTLKEAILWCMGRGGNYNIQIDNGTYPGFHLCVNNDKLLFECGYKEWVNVDIDVFCKKYG